MVAVWEIHAKHNCFSANFQPPLLKQFNLRQCKLKGVEEFSQNLFSKKESKSCCSPKIVLRITRTSKFGRSVEIVMNPQVVGRYQRARGLNLKRVLQFATVLTICLWILYQIKHPIDKNSASQFSKRHSILRWKVNMGWLTRRNESDLGGKIIGRSKTWERSAGYETLGKSQEKANKYLNDVIILTDDKDNERNHRMQWKDLHEGSDGDGVARLNKEGHKKDSVSEAYQNLLRSFMHSTQENLHKDAGVDGKKPEINVEIYSKVMKRKDVTVEQDLALELEVKDVVLPDRIDNGWQHGTENGLSGSGFDDENGVPPYLNDVTKSNDTE